MSEKVKSSEDLPILGADTPVILQFTAQEQYFYLSQKGYTMRHEKYWDGLTGRHVDQLLAIKNERAETMQTAFKKEIKNKLLGINDD